MVRCYCFFPQTNEHRAFNLNAKVILKACSNIAMVTHSWERTSNAAILGADLYPKKFGAKRPQPEVTVTMLATLPPSSRPSAPYKFTVTAKFDGYKVQTTASATLRINYVRTVP